MVIIQYHENWYYIMKNIDIPGVSSLQTSKTSPRVVVLHHPSEGDAASSINLAYCQSVSH